MTTDSGRPREEEARTPAGLRATRRTLARLCDPVATVGRRQGFDGLCVSRSLEQRLAGVLYASDPASRRLDELQQVIGEGPGITALSQRSPVLVPNLHGDVSARRWAVFRQEAEALDVASLFCFPVQMGAVGLGLLTVRGRRPVRLDDATLGAFMRLSDALAVAFIAPDQGAGERDGGAEVAADGLPGSGDGPVGMPWGPESDLLDARTLVTHQAVGMVSVQLGCSLEEAMVAIRSRAYTDGTTVAEVARAVVARRTRLGAAIGNAASKGEDGKSTRGENDG